MKKKQARYGKSGGQPSSSQSPAPSGKKPQTGKPAESNPKSPRLRHRPSIHENFEWGFVSGENEPGFEADSPRRASGVPATSKKPMVKKTTVKKEPVESGQNEGKKNKRPSPNRKEVPQGPKEPPSTLFQSDDWDEDLALPSYGRTMLHTALPQDTAAVKIVPEPPQKEKIERDRTKRPVKEPPTPPKKIAAKPVERSPKREEKAVVPQKATEAPVAVKPKEPATQTDRKMDSGKRKRPDPQYAIPPLPPRERLRWDPEKREYVRETEKEPSVEKKAPPPVAPVAAPQEKSQEKKKDPIPPTKEQRRPTVKEKKEPLQAKKQDSHPAPNKVLPSPAKRPPRGMSPSPKSEHHAHPADMEAVVSTGFKKLPISETMLEALKAVRYLEPTPIQAGVIPPVMKGVDVLGQAQTGTGKTAAFLIPLIEGVEECEPGNSPVALILVPTRELAVQVRDEAFKLSYGRDVRVTACYGGKPIAKNLLRLREGVDIIIGTPGRLLDLMKRGALSCNMLRWVVLDEADRMLDIGFRPDIEKILARTPSDRQTLLFSATLPPQVIRLAKKYMIDPEILDFSARIAVETIEQYYITVDQMRKYDALVQLLKQEEPAQAIIFCRTKRGADRVGRMLESQFANLATIHGDLAQPVRDKVMAQFRAGTLRYLVATDVVGRGIDVSGISHIINYDIPTFCDDYVHRVGRTGRMGREGVAFTFVTAEEGSELTRIEMRIDRLLKRADLKDFEAFAKPTDSTVVDPFGPAQGKPIFGKPTRKIRRAL